MKKILNNIILLLACFYVLVTLHPSFAALIPGKALGISLQQSAVNNIKVSRVFIDNNNPQSYNVAISEGFYTIKIYDQNVSELWSGQIANQTIEIDDYDPSSRSGDPVTIMSDTNFNLRLPFFAEAKWVKIYDEAGNVLLEINLDLYSITTTDRFAECDECGYCKGAKPPQNWSACRACLYPAASADHRVGQTLLLDRKGRPALKGIGRAYNDFGCIISPAGFMSAEGRASSAQFFLTIIYTVSSALAMLAIIYGAFQIISAKGNHEQISRGKRIIIRAIVGLILVYGMVFLINFIGSRVLRLPGFA